MVKPAAPGEVRIIGGKWKRSKLPVPVRPGLRPTPDRVRETLFNWLGQDLTAWTVLDAFAGSGSLGFEAASRGASRVQLLEADASLVSGLRASAQRLGAQGLTVECCHALNWMRQQPEHHYDLVLLDPPFASDLFEPALREGWRLVRPGGALYLEAPQPWRAGPEGLEPSRTLKAGAVCAQLWFKPVQEIDA